MLLNYLKINKVHYFNNNKCNACSYASEKIPRTIGYHCKWIKYEI